MFSKFVLGFNLRGQIQGLRTRRHNMLKKLSNFPGIKGPVVTIVMGTRTCS